MESSDERVPTPAEAAVALEDAEAQRDRFAGEIAVPSGFFVAMAVAVAVQIATAAWALGDPGRVNGWLLGAGVAVFVVVAGVQWLRFRRLNGVGLGGFTSKVVLGAGTAASVSYGVALWLALWSALEERPGLVGLFAVLGGVGYAVGERSWLARYRAEPTARHGGGPVLYLAVLVVVAAAGLVALLLGA